MGSAGTSGRESPACVGWDENMWIEMGWNGMSRDGIGQDAMQMFASGGMGKSRMELYRVKRRNGWR